MIALLIISQAFTNLFKSNHMDGLSAISPIAVHIAKACQNLLAFAHIKRMFPMLSFFSNHFMDLGPTNKINHIMVALYLLVIDLQSTTSKQAPPPHPEDADILLRSNIVCALVV